MVTIPLFKPFFIFFASITKKQSKRNGCYNYFIRNVLYKTMKMRQYSHNDLIEMKINFNNSRGTRMNKRIINRAVNCIESNIYVCYNNNIQRIVCFWEVKFWSSILRTDMPITSGADAEIHWRTALSGSASNIRSRNITWCPARLVALATYARPTGIVGMLICSVFAEIRITFIISLSQGYLPFTRLQVSPQLIELH